MAVHAAGGPERRGVRRSAAAGICLRVGLTISEPPTSRRRRAYLAQLQADQTAPAAALRHLGRDPEDDGAYLQRAEWIAGLEARHGRQQRDVRPIPSVEQRRARGRPILAAI